MSAKHRDPEFRKNARIVRQRVARSHRLGLDVCCWRCGRPLAPDQAYDVGHRDPAGGSSLSNLSPEHRHKSAVCRGNRAAGGSMGATITNRGRATTSGLLPW